MPGLKRSAATQSARVAQRRLRGGNPGQQADEGLAAGYRESIERLKAIPARQVLFSDEIAANAKQPYERRISPQWTPSRPAKMSASSSQVSVRSTERRWRAAIVCAMPCACPNS